MASHSISNQLSSISTNQEGKAITSSFLLRNIRILDFNGLSFLVNHSFPVNIDKLQNTNCLTSYHFVNSLIHLMDENSCHSQLWWVGGTRRIMQSALTVPCVMLMEIPF